jgi:hypothetical protein
MMLFKSLKDRAVDGESSKSVTKQGVAEDGKRARQLCREPSGLVSPFLNHMSRSCFCKHAHYFLLVG